MWQGLGSPALLTATFAAFINAATVMDFAEMLCDQCCTEGQSKWEEAFIIIIRSNKTFAPSQWTPSHTKWMSALGLDHGHWRSGWKHRYTGVKVALRYIHIIINFIRKTEGNHVTISSNLEAFSLTHLHRQAD